MLQAGRVARIEALKRPVAHRDPGVMTGSAGLGQSGAGWEELGEMLPSEL